MKTTPRLEKSALRRRPGVTLLEVLVAIFITGIGLQALLTLFPLGALEMARAIKDDRAAKLASDAAAFSEAGLDLLAETEEFLQDSLANGFADPQTVAGLRAAYADLEDAAADLELRLIDLKPVVQNAKARRQLQTSLATIKAIQAAARKMDRLLKLLADPNLPG